MSCMVRDGCLKARQVEACQDEEEGDKETSIWPHLDAKIRAKLELEPN